MANNSPNNGSPNNPSINPIQQYYDSQAKKNREGRDVYVGLSSANLDEIIKKYDRLTQIAKQHHATQEDLEKIDKRRLDAIKAFNDYTKSNANGMIEELKDAEELLKINKQNYELAGDTAKAKKAEQELLDLQQRRANIETTLQKTRAANVPVAQKMADLERRTNQRNEDHLKNEAKYNEKLAALDADRTKKQNAGKWTTKDDKQYKKNIADAKAEMDTAEAESERNTGVQLGGMGDLLGQLAGGGGAIGEIVKGVTSIIGIVDIVKGLFSSNPIGAIVKILTKIVDLVAAGFKKLGEGIEMYANVQTEYLGKVNSRLMGTNLTFEVLTDTFASTFGSNPYINQKSLIETMSALVESGVAYNLEQRTILSELSDRMVSTFDMLEGWLTRLTRLQQADMSVVAMGNEGLLTTFLNENFEDSSYMSDMYDTVAAALVDATAQMDAKSASEFNYAVQKWLGSLYSLGMSSEGINTLLEGIGYLATGDVEALNSNDSLRTLFAMASGGSYSDLLTGGLSSTSVNTLLNNIVTYLANIYGDTNKVVEQAKAGVFGGLSLSDIRAAYNTSLSASTISAESTNWGLSTDYVQSTLLSNAEANTAYATQIDNIIENTLYTIGETFVNSKYGYGGLIPKALQGKSKYFGWRIGEEIGGTIGTAIQIFTSASEIFDIIDTLADDFASINKGLGELGSVDISDRFLIKTRGDSYTNYTGAFTGLSSSTVYAVEGVADEVLSNTYASNAETISNSKTEYSDYSTLVTKDISSLYSSLFEDQLPIKVILSDLENTALTKLCINEGHLSIYAVGGVLSSIAKLGTEAAEAVSNALTNSVATNGNQTWDIVIDPDSVGL